MQNTVEQPSIASANKVLLELIAKAQNHDNNSFNILVEMHKDLIIKKTNRFSKQYSSLNLPREDVIQDVTCGFWNAVKSFNQSRGASFKSLASKCIDNYLTDTVRWELRAKKFDIAYDSEERLESIVDENSTPQYLNEISDLAGALRKSLESLLNTEQLKVWDFRGNGFTHREIAENMNIPTKKVENIISSIKKTILANKNKLHPSP